MRFIVGMLLSLVAFIGPSRAHEGLSRQGSAEQKILKLEEEWARAIEKKDKAWVERILSDDYIGIGIEGTVETKADELRNLVNSRKEGLSVTLGEMKVRLYADTAVVTGTVSFRSKEGGEAKPVRCRWSEAWVKRNGSWQCVSSQSTRIVGDGKTTGRS